MEVEVPPGEGGLPVRSVAQAIQVRTIDRDHRVESIAKRLTDETMREIGDALRLALDLDF